MSRTAIVALVVTALVACDRGNAPTADECSTTANAIVKAMQSSHGKPEQAQVKLIAERCSKDRWSTDTRDCMAKVSARDDVRQCAYKHLTHEQEDKLLRPSGDFKHPMVMMERFKDEMCACKDAKCAQGVADEMTKWSQEMAKELDDPPKMSDEDTKRATAIGEEMGKCMQVAMSVPDKPLEIIYVDPPKGDAAGGTHVQIVGHRFVADGPRNAKVYFGPREAKVLRFASDQELMVETPAGKPGESVDVRVVFEPGGELKIANAFTFVANP